MTAQSEQEQDTRGPGDDRDDGACSGPAGGDRPRLVERPARRPASPRRVLADLGLGYVASAIVALVFSATGPVAVIFAAGSSGGLRGAEMASWIFAVFFVNGDRKSVV